MNDDPAASASAARSGRQSSPSQERLAAHSAEFRAGAARFENADRDGAVSSAPPWES